MPEGRPLGHACARSWCLRSMALWPTDCGRHRLQTFRRSRVAPVEAQTSPGGSGASSQDVQVRRLTLWIRGWDWEEAQVNAGTRVARAFPGSLDMRSATRTQSGVGSKCAHFRDRPWREVCAPATPHCRRIRATLVRMRLVRWGRPLKRSQALFGWRAVGVEGLNLGTSSNSPTADADSGGKREFRLQRTAPATF
jgi:hypothetical protein